MSAIESLLEIYNIDPNGGISYQALFDDAAQSEDLVDAVTSFSEACLFLSELGVNSYINPTNMQIPC